MSMRCPTCGTVYGDEARFCTKDGGRQIPFAGIGGTAPSVPASGSNARATTPRAITPEITQKGVLNHANMAGQVLDGRYAIVK